MHCLALSKSPLSLVNLWMLPSFALQIKNAKLRLHFCSAYWGFSTSLCTLKIMPSGLYCFFWVLKISYYERKYFWIAQCEFFHESSKFHFTWSKEITFLYEGWIVETSPARGKYCFFFFFGKLDKKGTFSHRIHNLCLLIDKWWTDRLICMINKKLLQFTAYGIKFSL